MHLLVGFVQVMLAHFLAGCYRLLHFDWIGRRVVRLCCAAYLAGAGLDEGAFEVIQSMGDDGLRLLKDEAKRQGEKSIASLVLKIWYPGNKV